MHGTRLRQRLRMIASMVHSATPIAPAFWLRATPLVLALALPWVAHAQSTAAAEVTPNTPPAETLPWGSGWERRQPASEAESAAPGVHRNPSMQPGGAGFARGGGGGGGGGRRHR